MRLSVVAQVEVDQLLPHHILGGTSLHTRYGDVHVMMYRYKDLSQTCVLRVKSGNETTQVAAVPAPNLATNFR